MLVRPALRKMRDRFDYRQYGAVPLIGVNGTVFIGHGSSDRTAVAAAVRSAADAARRGLVEALREAGEQASEAAARR